MTQKTYAKGSKFPALKKDVWRIYSMRFCPYAQRTRMVLVHKEIPHETINVHLKQKPDWFLARNPLGLVPTIEKNDLIVYDSAICDDYLDEVYPQKKLTPSDPYSKARHRMIAEHFNKVISAYNGVYSAEDKAGAMNALISYLDPIENFLDDDFFGGKDVAMIDFNIWPWIERFGMVNLMVGTDVLAKDRFPKLKAYIERMWQEPAVKATGFDVAAHWRYVKSYQSGKPDYDFGL